MTDQNEKASRTPEEIAATVVENGGDGTGLAGDALDTYLMAKALLDRDEMLNHLVTDAGADSCADLARRAWRAEHDIVGERHLREVAERFHAVAVKERDLAVHQRAKLVDELKAACDRCDLYRRYFERIRAIATEPAVEIDQIMTDFIAEATEATARDIELGGFSVDDLRARAHGACIKCGQPATVFTLCDPCFAASVAGYDRLKARFEFMVSNGMDRAQASKWLSEKLRTGWEP